MVLADSHNVNTIWAPLILSLVAVGGVLVPNQVLITVITPDDLIASITALTVGLRAQCQVIGLAIFYNRLQSQIMKYVAEDAVGPFIAAGFTDPLAIQQVVTGLTSFPFDFWAATVPEFVANPAGAALVKEAMIEVFRKSFEGIWYITIAFGVVACIAAAGMGSIYKYMDKHVAVIVQN